jgi:hypothetical protein
MRKLLSSASVCLCVLLGACNDSDSGSGSAVRNQAPLAADDSIACAQDQSVQIDVLLNDSDPDSDPLSLDSAASAMHGLTAVTDQQRILYTPTTGFYGTDSFSYTISDGNGAEASATVLVIVDAAPVNTPPNAVADHTSTPQDTPVDIDMLANDTDDDGDALTVIDVDAADHGVVTVNADGSVRYAPELGYSGEDTFAYTISDGRDTDSATVVVGVTAAGNTAPVCSDDTASTEEDAAVVIDVLANDTDADSDPLTVAAFDGASHGTVSSTAGGALVYLPDADFNGSDSFTYLVGDGRGGTALGVVSVTVAAANDAPVANDDAVQTAYETPVTIDVLANDSDIDGDPLTVGSVTGPGHGNASISTAQTVEYEPETGFSGSDSFTYVADDGQGGTAV